MSIVIENLTKTYGDKIGVDHLSLSVAKGQFMGFIGPNGAGKSTTLRVLMNLLKPDRGTITIDGMDAMQDALALKLRIGYLPSEVKLLKQENAQRLSDLAIEMRCVAINRLQSSQAAKAAKAQMLCKRSELVERLDIELNRKFGTLSFGNQKKVGLLLCLLHEPSILLLDEATGGLDPMVQDTLYELLMEAHSKGATVLYSSHVLSEIEKLCRQVAVIKSGHIVAQEAIDAFKAKRLKHLMLTLEPDSIEAISQSIFKHEAVHNFSRSSKGCEFDWASSSEPLIALLNQVSPTDFTVTEPSLEMVFKHFYKEA